MKIIHRFFFGAMILFGIGCAASLSSPIADPRADRERMSATDDPGCTASTLVSTGGAFPKDSRTLAIRWTGYTNYELAYNSQIILLDAHFDRGSMFPPLGFTAADIKRANVILLGHGHLDHMSDAASVGARTGAIVVGAPVTTDKLKTQAIDPKQIRTVTGRGGELLEFPGYKVEPILGRHGEPPKNVTEAFDNALKATAPAPTKEQIAERNKIRERGTNDPRVVAEGTIAYLITLDNGFRIMFRDSGGVITDYEKARWPESDVWMSRWSRCRRHFCTPLRRSGRWSMSGPINRMSIFRAITMRRLTVCGELPSRSFRRSKTKTRTSSRSRGRIGSRSASIRKIISSAGNAAKNYATSNYRVRLY